MSVIAVLILVTAIPGYISSPAYVEKRLTSRIGPGYRIDIGSSHYNPLRQTFEATAVSVVSDSTRPGPTPGFDRPRKRSSLGASSVRASGINLLALWKGNIDVDTIVIEKPEVRLFIDRGVPPAHAKKSRRMPHQVLASSNSRVRPLRRLLRHPGRRRWSSARPC